jgi:hypothetical protein
VSDSEAARRAGGRRRYNALRALRAELRRREVHRLVVELGGLGVWGLQSRIASALGVHRSTVHRDFWKLYGPQP